MVDGWLKQHTDEHPDVPGSGGDECMTFGTGGPAPLMRGGSALLLFRDGVFDWTSRVPEV